MRIAFVDLGDPTHPHTWSGIPSRMIDGFSAQSDVAVVGKLSAGMRPLYLGHKMLYRLAGRRFDEQRTRFSLNMYSVRLRRALTSCEVDAVVAPGSLAVAHLDYHKPTAFWTDACFGAMPEYYDDFTRLCSRSRSEGDAQERAALARCDLAIYASDWAAGQCRQLYPEYADKVRVVPFGANFDPGLDEAAADALVRARSGDRCHLLFIGVDWKRKGGEIALAACQLMNAAGIPTTLTIVGCHPPFGPDRAPANVEIAGFLSRAVPQAREELARLFRRSHFLVLPSRAEAFGIVLCEAASFAVPSVATRTGGIATIVEDQVTGRLLPVDPTGEETAAALLGLFEDRDRYREVALAAFRKYRTRLNWTTACESILSLLRQKM
jgi:glycosyltransferase involved in cell wall biosynthesis